MRHSIASPAIHAATTSASSDGPAVNHRPIIVALNATTIALDNTLPRRNRRFIEDQDSPPLPCTTRSQPGPWAFVVSKGESRNRTAPNNVNLRREHADLQ